MRSSSSSLYVMALGTVSTEITSRCLFTIVPRNSRKGASIGSDG